MTTPRTNDKTTAEINQKIDEFIDILSTLTIDKSKIPSYQQESEAKKLEQLKKTTLEKIVNFRKTDLGRVCSLIGSFYENTFKDRNSAVIWFTQGTQIHSRFCMWNLAYTYMNPLENDKQIETNLKAAIELYSSTYFLWQENDEDAAEQPKPKNKHREETIKKLLKIKTDHSKARQEVNGALFDIYAKLYLEEKQNTQQEIKTILAESKLLVDCTQHQIEVRAKFLIQLDFLNSDLRIRQIAHLALQHLATEKKEDSTVFSPAKFVFNALMKEFNYVTIARSLPENEAFAWYSKGADAGDEPATLECAICYTLGKGTPFHYLEAMKLFNKIKNWLYEAEIKIFDRAISMLSTIINEHAYPTEILARILKLELKLHRAHSLDDFDLQLIPKEIFQIENLNQLNHNGNDRFEQLIRDNLPKLKDLFSLRTLKTPSSITQNQTYAKDMHHLIMTYDTPDNKIKWLLTAAPQEYFRHCKNEIIDELCKLTETPLEYEKIAATTESKSIAKTTLPYQAAYAICSMLYQEYSGRFQELPLLFFEHLKNAILFRPEDHGFDLNEIFSNSEHNYKNYFANCFIKEPTDSATAEKSAALYVEFAKTLHSHLPAHRQQNRKSLEAHLYTLAGDVYQIAQQLDNKSDCFDAIGCYLNAYELAEGNPFSENKLKNKIDYALNIKKDLTPFIRLHHKDLLLKISNLTKNETVLIALIHLAISEKNNDLVIEIINATDIDRMSALFHSHQKMMTDFFRMFSINHTIPTFRRTKILLAIAKLNAAFLHNFNETINLLSKLTIITISDLENLLKYAKAFSLDDPWLSSCQESIRLWLARYYSPHAALLSYPDKFCKVLITLHDNASPIAEYTKKILLAHHIGIRKYATEVITSILTSEEKPSGNPQETYSSIIEVLRRCNLQQLASIFFSLYDTHEIDLKSIYAFHHYNNESSTFDRVKNDIFLPLYFRTLLNHPIHDMIEKNIAVFDGIKKPGSTDFNKLIKEDHLFAIYHVSNNERLDKHIRLILLMKIILLTNNLSYAVRFGIPVYRLQQFRTQAFSTISEFKNSNTLMTTADRELADLACEWYISGAGKDTLDEKTHTDTFIASQLVKNQKDPTKNKLFIRYKESIEMIYKLSDTVKTEQFDRIQIAESKLSNFYGGTFNKTSATNTLEHKAHKLGKEQS